MRIARRGDAAGAAPGRFGAAQQRADPPAIRRWKVRALGVEPFVAGDQIGSVLAQPVHEDVADLATHVQARFR